MTQLDQRKALKLRLLTCGASLAIASACAFTTPAFAQETAASAPDETVVVVTGIRRGIQSAISAKKRSSQIVEAVSAEDIGKLPDASIAESIARLPGIAAQRTNGRAQSLSVRGLGPDYTVTTLNGREQVSTNDNRSVEFDQYPSELISQVLIYKTPNAAMITQGIAGTADLQTVRPLAYGKRAAAFSVRGEVNSEDANIPGMKNSGNRYSFMYIDQFADKTIGLALGYAHTDSPYQVQRKEPWGDGGFPTCGANASTSPVCTGNDANLLIIGGMKDGINSSNLTRDGYMGVLEWKPNDQLHVTLDAYHSDFHELQRTARLEFPLAWSGAQLQPGYTAGNTFVTHGVFENVATVAENYINQREAKLDAVGVNVEFKPDENWTLLADVALSKAVRDDLLIESTAGTGVNGTGALDTITFDSPDTYGRTTLSNVLDYSDFDSVFLTDPGNWGGAMNRAGFVRTPHVEDELRTIKLAASRKFDNVFSNVTIGFSQTHREKSRDGFAGYLTLPSLQVAVPEKYRQGTTDTSFFGTTDGMIAYDARGMWNDGFFGVLPDTSAATAQDTWNIDETIDVAFIKGDLDTTVFNIPMTGNIGLQTQHAEQTATSYYTDGTPTGLTLKTQTVAYTDLLPSINLNFAVADNMTLRFGAGSTLARPRMDDMGRGISFTPVCDTCQPVTNGGNIYYWSGNGGNPTIQPWKANAVDLSLEKYFGGKGYVSVAGFYKELTSYIFNQTILRDYTGAALPAAGSFTLADNNRAGTISVQQNGSGGWIKGVELTVSVPGEMLTPYLNGFGVIVSAAFNDSQINPSGTNAIALPGLSRKVINSTVYYEKHGFSARLSNRYRGSFLGEVPNFSNNLQNRFVAAESLLDAQLGYTFEEGSLKGLTLSFSATNITNEPFKLYAQGNPANVMREEAYGSTYLFGLSYRIF